MQDTAHAVVEWTAMDNIFPNGLEAFYLATGMPIVAHNRHWSRNNTYDVVNGGDYEFIRGKKICWSMGRLLWLQECRRFRRKK